MLQIFLCIFAFLLSTLSISLASRKYGIVRTRAIADFLWVLVGGIGAFVAFVSSVYIARVESGINTANSANVRLQISDSILQSAYFEHCAARNTNFLPVFQASCEYAFEISRVRREYFFLWAVPQNKAHELELQNASRIGASLDLSGTTRDFRTHSPPLLSNASVSWQFSEEHLSTLNTTAPERTLSAPWYCFDVVDEVATGCVGETANRPTVIDRPPSTERSGMILLTEGDPIRPIILNVLAEISQTAVIFRDLRSEWWPVLYLPQIELVRFSSFILLCMAFPLRLWRSISDIRVANQKTSSSSN
ncbi:hypothetical protein [Roseicyclus mahoneyensis]|uniref:Uncharacterized protein n=1 Tax=Roseicyclus mahoneyensis TaxID=164332 RepID=A0A316GPV3_9RHOB|nr:hypothetical protein [Roseicyclus mahoneyensis]PWK62658.1 hypothetical protein C7455_101688 [Roseicyclus mahoneyensis]